MKRIGRIALTLAVVAVAGVAGAYVWSGWMDAPWTRDGRVRADVVGVAPDVSGPVAEVLVHDNQAVQRGDVLFRVDTARFQLALQQADAAMKSREAAWHEAVREASRYRSLSNAEVSEEKQQQRESAAQEAAAAYQQSQADRSVAQLNLDRATVTAPEAGIVTNFDLRPGDYVAAGHAVTALVATDSLHIDGYFEETKLPRIHVGDAARVQLMGESGWLRGHVESIAGGVVDRERSAGSNLLADVNPTFSWVRLAQRIPVRIALDTPPPGLNLIAGRTATVRIDTGATATASLFGWRMAAR